MILVLPMLLLCLLAITSNDDMLVAISATSNML